MVFMVGVFATPAAAALPLTPLPTFNVTNDEDGADDQPGQKDLSLQGVATPMPGDLWTMWQWDETSLSGGNTGDACSLFDTDNDAKVNFSVCVTIEKKPAVQAANSPRVYNCGNGKVDRCSSTSTLVSPIETACATNTNATDPFHSGKTDTQAICRIALSDVGGANAKLINTCSYPSQSPTSDPSDCVLIPRDAFITIVKNALPNNTGTQFPFRLGTDAAASNPVLCTITNSGNCTSIAIRSGIAYNLKEEIPANWALNSPAPVCSGASGTGTSNGSVSGATISAIKAASDNTITCTYNDIQQTGAIRVTKLHSGTATTLNGAVFTIGSFTGLTTAGSGTVCKEGLPLGASYDVTETAAPNGYDVATPATQSVAVNAAGTCASGAVQATFNDPVVPGTINIHKTDAAGGALQGATFTLYVNNAPLASPRGDAQADPITTKSCTTNAAGDCQISSIALGDYWVVETGVPSGYIAAPDRAVNIGLGTAPEQGDTDSLTFVDAAAAGTINVHKTGLNGGDLAGATFTLWINNAPLGSRGLEDSATAKTCLTNASGNCTIDDVAPGTYWLVESTTPAGYDTAGDEAVTVPIGSQAGQGATVGVTIADPVVPGTVNIHKTGINGTDLNGATFTLYVDNPTVGGTRTGADTITTTTCTTSGAGVCSITGVAPGNYWVVETTTPNGYDTAPEQTVSVGLGASAHVGDIDSLTFADPVVPGTVSITKKDDANNTLNGAEFTLYTDVAPTGGTRNATNPDPITNPAEKCTTSGSGTCDITNVAPGRYWVVETVTPDGYDTAADQAITVGIGAAAHVGATVAVSFVDARKHRVVVLVCHEGTDDLLSSDVTVNGTTKQSLAAGTLTAAQQKALCDTGGASFGDISGHAKVTADVDLGGS